MTKLWTVSIMTEVVVAANTETEAEQLAQDTVYDMSAHEYDYCATTFTGLPSGWDELCLPYGNHNEKTIKEWLNTTNE